MQREKLVLKAEGQQVPGKPKEKVSNVVVEVDMLDSEKEPSRTQHVKVARGGARMWTGYGSELPCRRLDRASLRGGSWIETVPSRST